jgi:hypothetical protein
MLKLFSSGMKKGMPILLAAFFVVSLTAVAASAHHGCYGCYGCCDGYGFYGCGCGGYPWGIAYPYC